MSGIRELTYAEWLAEAKGLFGDDSMAWEFVCPVCKYPQTVQDYKDAGAPSTAAGFSCVGRWIAGTKAFEEEGEGPCNYAGGGLFRLNPVQVKMEDGEVVQAFDWSETVSGVV